MNWFDTVEFPKDGDGCRWDSTQHDPVTRVRLQGVGSRFPRRKAKDRTTNHQRAVDNVADLHRKARRQRLDDAHKSALDLVREHDFIAHEDLKVGNMSRSPVPRPDPDQVGVFLPNGAAAKAGLNKSINDAGWGCS